jgi:hypothetical protein
MYDNVAGPPPAPWFPAQNPYGPPMPDQNRPHWTSVLSLILSAMALIGVLGITVWVTMGESVSATLTGQVRADASNDPVSGQDLQAAVRDVLERDGADVSILTCPDTPQLKQGVVSVCHGTMDGDSWAFVVFVEDTQGHFTLQSL